RQPSADSGCRINPSIQQELGNSGSAQKTRAGKCLCQSFRFVIKKSLLVPTDDTAMFIVRREQQFQTRKVASFKPKEGVAPVLVVGVIGHSVVPRNKFKLVEKSSACDQHWLPQYPNRRNQRQNEKRTDKYDPSVQRKNPIPEGAVEFLL